MNLSAEIKRGAKREQPPKGEGGEGRRGRYSQRLQPIVVIKTLRLSRPIRHKEIRRERAECARERERNEKSEGGREKERKWKR